MQEVHLSSEDTCKAPRQRNCEEAKDYGYVEETMVSNFLRNAQIMEPFWVANPEKKSDKTPLAQNETKSSQTLESVVEVTE